MTIDIIWLEEKVFLHKLYENEIQIVRDLFREIDYQCGDEIIRQGERGEKLRILRSGYVAVSQRRDGRFTSLGDAEEGALFGELSFLSGNEANATVTAMSECTIYELNRENYCTLMTQSQELLLGLFTHMLSNASNVISRMNMRCSAVG